MIFSFILVSFDFDILKFAQNYLGKMETLLGKSLKVSKMAAELKGSEIIKLAGEVKAQIARGKDIKNLTIGDFDPSIFPIPDKLKDLIVEAYKSNKTNYPAANGIQSLRDSISQFIEHYGDLSYKPDELLIAGGARPLIYAVYQTLIDPGDKVIFPVPSWNNNHYTHLSRGNCIFIEAGADNNFMPTADQIAPHISEATLIAVCSPLNPTGTCFKKEDLAAICELVIAENKKRDKAQKPVYLLYDQIYWKLTHGETQHYDPVSLNPEMRNYTIYIDGISKAFAATGVRVGWTFGPVEVINKMRSVLGHIGAWAPRAEQEACAAYLSDFTDIDTYNTSIKRALYDRLLAFHKGIDTLNKKGLPIKSIGPEAAMYLTVQIPIINRTTKAGKIIKDAEDIATYLISDAKLALVPFYAFGADRSSSWFRLSAGTVRTEDIDQILLNLETALNQLQ